jgi:hypothetical protein
MVSQNKQANKQVQQRYTFNNIGWSAIAFVSLVAIFCLISYRSQIAYKYLNLVDVFFGILLVASIVSIIVGVWKASLRWKYLSVALAIVWLIPFVLYMMLFAGPLFDMRDVHFTW